MIKAHTILSKHNGGDRYSRVFDTECRLLNEKEARELINSTYTGYGISISNGRKSRECLMSVRLGVNPRLKLFQSGKVDKLVMNYDTGGNYLL